MRKERTCDISQALSFLSHDTIPAPTRRADRFHHSANTDFRRRGKRRPHRNMRKESSKI